MRSYSPGFFKLLQVRSTGAVASYVYVVSPAVLMVPIVTALALRDIGMMLGRLLLLAQRTVADVLWD